MPLPIDGKRNHFTLDEIISHLREGIYGAHDLETLELHWEFERAVRAGLGSDISDGDTVTVRDIKMFLQKQDVSKTIEKMSEYSPKELKAKNIRFGTDGYIYVDAVLENNSTFNLETRTWIQASEVKPKWRPENSSESDWS
jgi:hypothetical protein